MYVLVIVMGYTVYHFVVFTVCSFPGASTGGSGRLCHQIPSSDLLAPTKGKQRILGIVRFLHIENNL